MTPTTQEGRNMGNIFTESKLIAALGDVTAKFGINAEQAELIAAKAINTDDPISAFERIRKTQAWWV